MSTKAEIKYVGEIRDLVSKINTLEAANRKLSKGLQEVKTSGKAAGDQTADGFRTATNTLVGVAGAIGLATSAMGMFRQATQLAIAEVKNLGEQRKSAGEAGVSVAARRAAALRNLPAGVAASDFDKMVRNVTKQRAFEIEKGDATDIVSRVLTTKANLPLHIADKIAMEAGREKRTNPLGDANVFAGAVGDLLKSAPYIQKMKDPVATAAGFIQQTQTQARAFDPAKLGKALGRSIAIGRSSGFSARESAALLASASQISADPEVRRSGTGVSNLMSNLALELTGQGVAGISSEKKGMELIYDAQRQLRAAGPEQRKKFIKKFKGRAATRGFTIGLLTEDPVVMEAVEQAFRGISEPGPESRLARARILKASVGGPEGAMLEADSTGKASLEMLKLANLRHQFAGVLQRDVPELLLKSGALKLAAEQAESILAVSKQGEVPERAIKMLRARALAIKAQSTFEVLEEGEEPGLSATEKRTIQILEMTADRYEQQLRNIDRMEKSNSQVEGN